MSKVREFYGNLGKDEAGSFLLADETPDRFKTLPDWIHVVDAKDYEKAMKLLYNICKEQSIPDFEMNVGIARQTLRKLGIE